MARGIGLVEGTGRARGEVGARCSALARLLGAVHHLVTSPQLGGIKRGSNDACVSPRKNSTHSGATTMPTIAVRIVCSWRHRAVGTKSWRDVAATDGLQSSWLQTRRPRLGQCLSQQVRVQPRSVAAQVRGRPHRRPRWDGNASATPTGACASVATAMVPATATPPTAQAVDRYSHARWTDVAPFGVVGAGASRTAAAKIAVTPVVPSNCRWCCSTNLWPPRAWAPRT